MTTNPLAGWPSLCLSVDLVLSEGSKPVLGIVFGSGAIFGCMTSRLCRPLARNVTRSYRYLCSMSSNYSHMSSDRHASIS
jgi:hypothetical protein